MRFLALRYFTVHVRILLKFSVSLSAWRVAEVFSHSLISNKNCLLWTSYWISRFSFWQCTTKSNQLTITWHIEMKGKYKTWTPSLDRVHGPGPSKYGPGPWNPYFYKLRLHYKLWFDDLWWHIAWFGKPCTGLIAHLPWKFMFNSSFSLSLVILKHTGWFWKV